MAIANRDNSVIEALTRTLKDLGFKRKAQTWYLDQPETIWVINLQRSRWAASFDINLGVWIKRAGYNPFPPSHHCHIITRLRPAARISQDRFDRALDLEDRALTAEERIFAISQALLNVAIPLLQKCSSIDSIRTAYDRGELEDVLIDCEGQKLCGIKMRM